VKEYTNYVCDLTEGRKAFSHGYEKQNEQLRCELRSSNSDRVILPL
jgi:hypothetical protein